MVDGGDAEDPEPTLMSSPVIIQNLFLELNFSARELALMTATNGRTYFQYVYAMDFIGALVYSIWFLMHVAAAMRRKDLTGAEIIACLFIICSALFVYDLCRFSAIVALITGFNTERDLGQWARRKLSERRFPSHILRNPYMLLRGTLCLHMCLFIVLIILTSLVPVI